MGPGTDFHNHLIPGVDDGAANLEEVRAALETMRAQEVGTIVTTPHLKASVTERPDVLAATLQGLDAGWEQLRAVAAGYPDLRVLRGVELMLDVPAPDISDPRLRLAGTSFVLVEFPHMLVPPNSAQAVFDLKMSGWTPVIAHPERYVGVDENLAVLDEWRRVGGVLQVNCGSVLGRYGGRAAETAWRLLRRGWVSYLSSDYHARGRCAIAECRTMLREKGGEEHARLLMEVNPARLLDGVPPLPVQPLQRRRAPLWSRWFGRS